MAVCGLGSRTTRALLLLFIASAAAQGCGSSPVDPSGPGSGGTFQFTHIPVMYSSTVGGALSVTPAGYLSIGPNSIRPYMEFFGVAPASQNGSAIIAPADGTVASVDLSVPEQARIVVNASAGFRYYLISPSMTISVAPGLAIKAGQVVGHRSGGFAQGLTGVGLGLLHPTQRLGFLSPDRYPDELLSAAQPVDYFAEPARSLIKAAIRPTNATGELNFDIAGRLQGFWFLPSIPRSESTSITHSSGWLWFLKTVDAQNSGLVGHSVFALSPEGKTTTYFLENGTGPAAATVSVASGMVDYRLPYSSTNAVVIRVQMLTDTSVRAETFDTFYGLPAGFTNAAKTYLR
jgi:hypothetical protein